MVKRHEQRVKEKVKETFGEKNSWMWVLTTRPVCCKGLQQNIYITNIALSFTHTHANMHEYKKRGSCTQTSFVLLINKLEKAASFFLKFNASA